MNKNNSRKNKNLSQIAEAFEATVEQLEFIPYLLQDLWALGSYTDQIIELVNTINFSATKLKVLDLGCGKGANSIAIAEKFGISVKGIDGFEPFVEIAIKKSKEKNLSQLTSFICGDIKKLLSRESDYDLVLLASVGKIWDDYKTTIKNIRNVLKPGGYILIEEGFIKDKTKIKNHLYLTYDELVKQITFFKDEIVKEIIFPDEWLKLQNQQYNKVIQKRAEELYLLRPEKKPIIQQYVKRQIEESKFLEQNFRSAMWLIKKII